MGRKTSWIKSCFTEGNNKWAILIFHLFFFILPGLGLSQVNSIPQRENAFQKVHWTIQDGLSSPNCSYMRKDIQGFLWFGTDNGLNRFDGSIFKTYFHIAHDQKSIGGNSIMGIIEDSLHNLWIGTDRGLSRYDIKADTFTNFKPDSGNNPDFHILPFCSSRNNVYVIEMSTMGIYAYDIHNYSKKVYTHLTDKDSIQQRVNGPYSIFDSATNSVWMIRGMVNVPGGGLINISLTTGERKYYSWPCYRNIPNHCHFSEAMVYDQKRNALWINSEDGLMEFTLEDKKFRRAEDPKGIFSQKDYARFVGIDMDRNGKIWFATFPSGMLVYDPVEKSLEFPIPPDSIRLQDIGDANCVVYCDRDGMIWTGFWLPKGIFQLIPFSPAVKLFIPEPANPIQFSDNAVIHFRKADSGKVWVTTITKEYLFDKKSGSFKKLNEGDLPAYIGDHAAFSTVSDPDRGFAIIQADGKFLLSKMKGKKITPVIFKNMDGKQINIPNIFLSVPVRNGWVSQAQHDDKEGLFYGNWDSAVSREILQIPVNSTAFFNFESDGDHLLFLKRDEWIGNQTYSIDHGKISLVHLPLDSIQWTSIFFNKKDNTYWVAGEKVIFHFDLNFNLIQKYTRKTGFPDLDIVGLVADNHGNIWFHTDRSIHQLNIETGEVSTLAEKDGFIKQNFELLKFRYKDEDGDIYFPGGGVGKGFNLISPDKFTSPPSNVYLQSISVNQKLFVLPTGFNNLTTLSLSHSENKITIETGILDFYSRGSSHMRYKLESENDSATWQYAPANYTIRFEDLKPGKYSLRMQASNASLQFNGPVKLLSILVNPPWWQTWWARIIFGLLFITAITGYIQYRSRQLKEKNLMLEEKVLHRTKELKHSLEELRSTQNQLIQQEKMASLGELTAGIAHEIQNPLNFVNNFSDINAELIDEMKAEIKSGNMDEGMNMAEMIKDNNLKINHHGKRADSIVKGMLLHSRKSSGQKEPVKINELADEYLRLSYHGLRAKDKEFNSVMRTDFDKNIDKISIIPQDIGRVLLNLFNNAFYAVAEKKKIFPEGYEPTVTVSTKDLGNQVAIKIRDNGMGIPPKILDKIFQPFFTTKPAGQGTGLGLSLSYDIILKGHGGELKVDSKEGEYVEFTILLPNDPHA